MNDSHPPPFPAPAAPKSRSGCLTALYIFLGVVAVLFVVGAIGLFLFFRSETGQRVVTAVREGAGVVQEAMTAPGTQELRAAGCTQAMAFPFARINEIAQIIAPDAPTDEFAALGAETVILCQTRTALGCAEVARTYGSAIPDPPERFAVIVQPSGGEDCQGIYGPDGTLIEPLGNQQ